MSGRSYSYDPEVIFEHEKTARGEVCLGGGLGDGSRWVILNGKKEISFQLKRTVTGNMTFTG